jgi:DNA-binding LytR/AlgR family response regulator
MPLKVIIVDDEYPARQELRCIFEDISNIEVVAECQNGNTAYQKVMESNVDAIFLDIQMMTPTDGLVAAEKIRRLPQPPKIVFTTGYSDFAIQAFELEAIDYIMKPYSRERIEVTIERLTREETMNIRLADFLSKKEFLLDTVKLSVWYNDRLLVLQPSEIFFAQAENKRNTCLYTTRGRFISTMCLKEVQSRLESSGFFRSHKSFLVNLKKVKEIVPWFNNTYNLVIDGCPEHSIPVAKHFVKDFKHAMGVEF